MEKKSIAPNFSHIAAHQRFANSYNNRKLIKEETQIQYLIIVVNFKEKTWKECFDFDNGHLGICAGASNPGSMKIS